MSTKHTFDFKGKLKTANLTPMKAIRYQCLECLGGSPKEVRACTAKTCSLYPYRLGRRPIC